MQSSVSRGLIDMNFKLLALFVYAVCLFFLLTGPATTSATASGPDHLLSKSAVTEHASNLPAASKIRNQTFSPISSGTEDGISYISPVATPGQKFSPSGLAKVNISKPHHQEVPLKKPAMDAALNSLDKKTGITDTATLSEEGKEVIQANNQFALDLYRDLVRDPEYGGGNIFFSPWSLSSAMALVYEGARGSTAEEIRSVFHFPGTEGTLREGYSEILTGLTTGNSGYTLYTASALWAEKTYPFLPDYVSTANRYYGAKITNLDFINQPETSRTTINRWVEERTRNRIKDLLPAGSIHSLTRLVITNAIYFKGKWKEPFSKANTIEDNFWINPSQAVRIPMMKETDEDARFWYTETDTLQVLGMPYVHKSGHALSMLVLLPKSDDPETMETSLSAGKITELNQALEYKRVLVYFPRFRLETDYQMSDSLRGMGMPTAFSLGAADLSGMDGTKGLFVEEVFHKAFVEVNEDGTEAAAATGVTIAMGGEIFTEPVPVFRADHPFLFLIQDNDTGNILFIGRVVNPAAG